MRVDLGGADSSTFPIFLTVLFTFAWLISAGIRILRVAPTKPAACPAYSLVATIVPANDEINLYATQNQCNKSECDFRLFFHLVARVNDLYVAEKNDIKKTDHFILYKTNAADRNKTKQRDKNIIHNDLQSVSNFIA